MADSYIKKLLNNSKSINKDIYKPVFYNLMNSKDKDDFVNLLVSTESIIIIDEIESQLSELIKLRNPKTKFTDTELENKVKNYLNGEPLYDYGVWVYYPWLNKVIHLLNEEEFVEVRTNRNQYKITPEEEIELSKKTIGIIGLSVGKAIAITIAMERICGELIIADFDVIELSNLNRIQTGVQNFNLKKTVIVAREIAEIDPYLKVTCLSDGLTEENMNDFFFPNGKKMDLCIEVCDGLSTKIYARQKAKEFGVPVVMDTNDRGMIDIERFDIEPNLPILHGLVNHLDLNLAKQAKTNEEKVPYLLPMLGLETSSERLKASMLEIESTITTWPQLASGVIMGGGICTDVCRRVLLNQFTKSGRYFVDVETLINDDVIDYISANNAEEHINIIPKTNLDDYKEILKEANEKLFKENDNQSVELTTSEIEKIVKYAIMAPSGGNVQPWKWLYKGRNLLLFNDVNRCVSILNYKNTASLISLGAATENLILKTQQMGYEVEVEKFPLGVGNDLIAAFKFFKTKTDKTVSHQNNNLTDFISKRLTNRNLSNRVPLKPELELYFTNIINNIPGAKLKLFKEPGDIDKLKSILSEVDKLFMTNKVGHSHFIHEIRWNKKEVEETRDGIDINTIDLTPTERAGLIVSKNWNVTKHIKKWKLGNEFGKLSQKAVDSSSALGIITMPSFDANSFFEGGRAVQKLWLAATEKEIAFQPMSINTFLFAKVGDNNFDDIDEIKNELKIQYQNLRQVCALEENEKDVFFFRLAVAPEPKVIALRRTIEDVLMYE
ncbi:MAG: Rv1355c family protein [Flavobacteriales bacterium]|nr:Rv1355c family protein [Flavobacteriales bacterium]